MALSDGRICPNCGTRNKKGWEYCVRCGEDIRAVALGAPEPASASETPEPAAEGASWLSLIGPVVVVALVLYGVTRTYRSEGPSRPNPALFEMPTVPPSTPVGRVASATPAEQSFEEGRRLLAAGDAAGAAAALARAVADAPDNAVYRNMYGAALLGSGAPAVEIIRQFEEAIRLSPQIAEYVGDLARAYDKLGRNEEAARTYARGLEMSPDDRQMLRDVSSLHARAGHPEAALPYLKRLSGVSPDDLVIQQELALAYDKTGDKDGAKQAYQDILQKVPQAAVTRGLLSEMLLKEGKGDEAVAVLRAGIQADPSGALVHRTLASALERTGNVAAAVREYREYARLNPGTADAKAMEDRAARLEARVAQSS